MIGKALFRINQESELDRLVGVRHKKNCFFSCCKIWG